MSSKSFAVDEPRKEFHLCYFSLNNEKEFKVMKKFSTKLNKLSTTKINITEYQTKGSAPNKSFKEMIESGAECDGLVISGHHTGAFGGKRASGSLGIDYLEKLSCNPKYKKFFENINALWLQGCRTLGGKISPDTYQDTADYHTNRVGNVLEEDHLNQSFAELNMEFSATLDQDNPLSSRYLRVFPGATIFGWTASAPGKNAQSQFSIPFHMAHMSRLINKDSFEDPREEMSAVAVATSANTLSLLLTNKAELSPCAAEFTENLGIDGWLYHGQAKTSPQGSLPFSFANPDLQAHSSIATNIKENKTLFRAQKLNCDLKESTKLSEISTTLDEILNNDSLLHYNFNSIIELIHRFKGKENNEEINFIREKLKNSKNFNSFLKRKLEDKRVGIIRKIDYYAVYREFNENSAAKEKNTKALKKQVLKILTTPIEPFDYNQRDFAETLLQSLAKHKILNLSDYKVLIKKVKNKNLFEIIIDYSLELKISEGERIELLNSLLNFSDISSSSLLNITNAFFKLKTDSKKQKKITEKIVKHVEKIFNSPVVDENSLNNTMKMLSKLKINSKRQEKIVEKIMENIERKLNETIIDTWSLKNITDAFFKIKVDSKKQKEITEKIVKHIERDLNHQINYSTRISFDLKTITNILSKLKLNPKKQKEIVEKIEEHAENILSDPTIGTDNTIKINEIFYQLKTRLEKQKELNEKTITKFESLLLLNDPAMTTYYLLHA